MAVKTEVTMAELLLERPLPGVALLRLNRPEAKNALNMALRRRATLTGSQRSASRRSRYFSWKPRIFQRG